MATRTSSNLTVDSFAGYYGGWLSKSATDGSGYYFGKGSNFGPLCIKFKIPSINNFLNRNPTITFSFEANGVGYYTTCGFTATIRDANYSNNSTSAQGTAVSKAVQQSKSITSSSSSFTSVTTSEITITGSSVKADNSTYYYCWFTSPSGNYQVRKITGKVYYDQYTQCSAPTSVKFKYNNTGKASPYTHPSDNGTSGIEIKWDGATAGAGMSIKGYKIQRYDEEQQSWDKHDTTVTSNATSYTYTLTAGERGTVQSYRIITLGSIEGYDSDASSMVNIYFNSKPTKPKGSDLIVESTVETVEIPITIPITNYSYSNNTRTMTLWYSSDGENTWRNSNVTSDPKEKKIYNFQVNQTPIPGSSQDYHFKMKDNFGDESDVVTITLTRSVPLSIPSFKATLAEQREGVMNVSFDTDTHAHKDSIKIELMSGIESIANKTISWQDSINLLTEGPEYNGSMGLKYKFTLNASDDFGASMSKEATTYLNNNGTVTRQDITISALPNNVTLYNTLRRVSTEIPGVDGLRYFDKIRAEFGANSLMTSEATLYIGESSVKYTPIVGAEVFKFQLDSNEILNKLTSSALKSRIDFKFSLGTQITNSFSKTIYFSSRPSINIVSPFPTFGMYDQPINTFKINGVFNDFGLESVSISGIETLNYGATQLDLGMNGYEISSFNLARLFPLAQFDAGARQGTISQTITVTAANVLGVTQTAQTTITLDFRKLPSAINIGNITYGGTSLQTTKLCEGTEIQVPFTYTSYGGDAIRFVVYWDDVEKASTTVTPSGAATKEGTTTGNSGNLAFTVPVIPFGKTTANIVIKANLVGFSDVSSSNLATPSVSPYEDPGMNVLSSNLNNKTLTLNYSLNTQGAGTYTYKLLLKDENDIWTEEPTGGTPPDSFTLTNSLAGNRVARIQITYTYPTGTTRSNQPIESYSNTFVIFAEGPTVSYRKNQLGINTDNPSSECIIDIRPTSNYKKVRLYDGVSGGDSIELDLAESYEGSGSYPAIVIKKGTTKYTLIFD